MPKGSVPEREVLCRACEQPFRSTKVGRAAFYCHRPACDEDRKATGKRVPAKPTPERLAERERVRVEREQARERREQEAERRSIERQEHREATERARRAEVAAREQARQDARDQKAAAAEQRRVERAHAILAKRLAPIEARIRSAMEQRSALREQMDALIAPAPAPVSRPAPTAAVPGRPLRVDGALEARVAAARAQIGERSGRELVGRAANRLAHATGVPETIERLRELAVSALAWESQLSDSAKAHNGGREAGEKPATRRMPK